MRISRVQPLTKRAAPKEWQLQEAKARFSELFRLARECGPQRVTRHGREAVVVIPAEEYARLTESKKPRGSLVRFCSADPGSISTGHATSGEPSICEQVSPGH